MEKSVTKRSEIKLVLLANDGIRKLLAIEGGGGVTTLVDHYTDPFEGIWRRSIETVSFFMHARRFFGDVLL